MMATLLGEVTIPRLTERVTYARHQVVGIAAGIQGISGTALYVIELLASEVITNAVVHTKTDVVTVEVTADEAAGTLRVAARDDGSGGPIRVTTTTDPLSDHGRGLRLVQKLAARWGVDIGDQECVVWFEVKLDP